MKPFYWIAGMLGGLLFAGSLLGCGHTRDADTVVAPSDVVVATFADRQITLSEFERRYAHSVGSRASASQDSLSSYVAFLEQYLDFRLKVQAAYDAGYADDAAVKQDVASFRAEVGRRYLLDRKVFDPILRTLYERRQEEVNIAHLLIRVLPNATPADTISAHAHLASIAVQIDAGVAPREAVDRLSDGSEWRGRVVYQDGYITGGQTIQPLEDRAYSTPVGERSDIFRSDSGYHLIKVFERRPRQPAVGVAHILILRDGDAPADTRRARQRADSLRTEILAGADFGDLARRYSDDPPSAQQGGRVGMVDPRRNLPASFQEAAFALDEAGAVSEVVETEFGYHIIKLTDPAPRTFAEAYDELKEIADRLPRTKAAVDAFARRLRDSLGVSVDTTAIRQLANISTLDTSVVALHGIANGTDDLKRSPVTIGAANYAWADILHFASKADAGASLTISEVLDLFLNEKAIDKQAAALEKHDREVQDLVNRYRDGLFYFRVMQDSVWAASANGVAAPSTLHAPSDMVGRAMEMAGQPQAQQFVEVLRERYDARSFPHRLRHAFTAAP